MHVGRGCEDALLVHVRMCQTTEGNEGDCYDVMITWTLGPDSRISNLKTWSIDPSIKL